MIRKTKAKLSDGVSSGDIQALRAAIDELGSSQREREEYISLLRQCIAARSLPLGRRVHAHISEYADAARKPDTFISNLLIKMYGRCGSLESAVAAFAAAASSGAWDSYTWSNMIAAAAENGCGRDALQWAARMSLNGVRSNGFSHVACVSGAASLGPKGLVQGRIFHARILEQAGIAWKIVGPSLIDMYGKCGSVHEAREVFNAMPTEGKTIVAYTSLVNAFSLNGHYKEALEVFRSYEGDPDSVLFLSAVTACSGNKSIEDGIEVHDRVKKHGLERHSIVGNALVTMYGKFGMVDEARNAFDAIASKTLVSWNSLMAAYAQEGHRDEVMHLLRQMHGEGARMNAVTLVNALSSCTTKEAARDGIWIHRQAASTTDVGTNVYVATALLTMYGKCGMVFKARRIFEGMVEKNTVSWTAMLSAYAQNGMGQDALWVYWRMNEEGMKAGGLSLVSAIDACACTGYIPDGIALHERVVELGLEGDVYVATALVNMYKNFGILGAARRLFEGMKERNCVTWTSMIGAYVQNGYFLEALDLYESMEVPPTEATFLFALSACAAIGALQQGRAIHEKIIASYGYEKLELQVGNALVDMYGKCASLGDAFSTFGLLLKRNVVTWTSLMAAFSQLGLHKRAQGTLWRMLVEGFHPDAITLTVALHSFSHFGKVKEGRMFFRYMEDDYGMQPQAQHYDGMVDILSRGGFLKRAEELIETMPYEPTSVTWVTLLGACKTFSNLEPAEHAAHRAAQLEPLNPGPYVLLQHILYQRLDLRNQKLILERRIKDRVHVSANARCYIELNGKVCEFVKGFKEHVYQALTDLELLKINRDMVKEGLRKSGEEEKDHAAKRAVAVGVVTTLPGATIRVFKTLRLCAECHQAASFVSRARNRHIIVRDYSRFHEFKNGVCSCGDAWDDKRGVQGGRMHIPPENRYKPAQDSKMRLRLLPAPGEVRVILDEDDLRMGRDEPEEIDYDPMLEERNKYTLHLSTLSS